MIKLTINLQNSFPLTTCLRFKRPVFSVNSCLFFWVFLYRLYRFYSSRTFWLEKKEGNSGRGVCTGLDGSAGCRPSALRSTCLCAHPETWSPIVGRRDHVGPARLARAGGGRLLTAPTQGGDLVRCADVHRMVRSTCQWLAMIAGCMPRGVAVYGVLRPSAQAISRRMPSSIPTCASHPNSCLALVGR